MKKNLLSVLTIVLILSMVLAGCSQTTDQTNSSDTQATTSDSVEQSASSESASNIEQIIRAGIGSDEGSLDPATGTTSSPQQALKITYAGLYSFDEEGKLKNEMCESEEVSEDGMTITYHLRDAKWSDGVPVTAHDFVYGWQRNLVPELKAAYAELMSGIVNYEPCIAGEKALNEFGVKATDDKTLVVTLSKPQPYFTMMTTFSPFYPLREDKVPMDNSNWSMTDVADVVCNGPFKYEDYVANDKIVLVPNPEYWDYDKIRLEKIIYRFIPDLQAQVAAFKTGEIDVALYVPMDLIDTYDNKDEVRVVPFLVNNIYLFSSRVPALQDVRVRKAITLAINRDEICQILGGLNEPLYALVPPGVPNPATGEDFRAEGGDLVKENVEEAQRLLAEAGYPNGEGFPKIKWLFNNSQTHTDVAQAVDAQLKKNLNIELELQGLDGPTFSTERRAGNFEICRLGTTADYVDPTTWLNLYVSTSSYISRVSGYQTPEFDAMMEESDKILDVAQRFEKLHQAEANIVDQYWWIPISYYDNQLLIKSNVKNIYTTTAGDVFFTFAYLE